MRSHRNYRSQISARASAGMVASTWLVTVQVAGGALLVEPKILNDGVDGQAEGACQRLRVDHAIPQQRHFQDGTPPSPHWRQRRARRTPRRASGELRPLPAAVAMMFRHKFQVSYWFSSLIGAYTPKPLSGIICLTGIPTDQLSTG